MMLQGALLGWTSRLPFLPNLLTILIAVTFALALHWLIVKLVRRLSQRSDSFLTRALRRTRGPTRLAFVVLAMVIVAPTLSLEPFWSLMFQRTATMLLILTIGWIFSVVTSLAAERVNSRYRLDVEDNLRARQHVTQVRVLHRTVQTLIVLFTVGAMLLTFESVQRYGVSLLASAGAAGLVVGLAARPVFANLIAGVQIALTQPIRIDDVVIVEDEWGWIEEIRATYVTIRLWDWRRLVVPLSYFIEQPFQNWTRDSASIIGVVMWHVDYTMPIDRFRERATEIIKASSLWDGNVVNVQVVDVSERTIQVRGLMSARTSPIAWDLRCEVREKVLAWIQAEYPQCLPRHRAEIGGEMQVPAAPPPRPQTREEQRAADDETHLFDSSPEADAEPLPEPVERHGPPAPPPERAEGPPRPPRTGGQGGD
ncbi:mechanosensitive ion channel family protein [Plastorhodobacter daqingensis]|uniref:Mechanosensitive ion channel family protein n=1 Tax=Plastorhodobacter daqingensis TaxID=1387281 RepID=A0ABW2UMH1_9RHOB